MANSSYLYFLFGLCEQRGKFVYEVSNFFGESLTLEEMEYWACFNIISRAKQEKVDVSAIPMEDVITLTEESERRKRSRFNGKASKVKSK